MSTAPDRVLSLLQLCIDRAYDLATGKVVMPGATWQFDDPELDPLAWTTLIEQNAPKLGAPAGGFDGATPDDVRRTLTMVLTLPDVFSLPRIAGIQSASCTNALVRRAAELTFHTVLPGEPVPQPGAPMDEEMIAYAERGAPK